MEEVSTLIQSDTCHMVYLTNIQTTQKTVMLFRNISYSVY